MWYKYDIKNTFNKIRLTLNQLLKKILKLIASEILDNSRIAFEDKKEQCCLQILDIIDNKLLSVETTSQQSKISAPKNICIVHFVNKGIDQLHLSKVFKSDAIVDKLPEVLQHSDDIPVVTMRLDPPIRSKILNYKKTVNYLNIVRDGRKYTVENLPICTCIESPFCDSHHKHILTRDLRIIKNSKLRKLLSKGQNYRENKFINLTKCKNAVEFALIETMKNLTYK